jgi:hypothetical protein
VTTFWVVGVTATCCVIVSLTGAIGRRSTNHVLVSLLLVAGLLQAPLVSLLQAPSLLVVDDVIASYVVAVAVLSGRKSAILFMTAVLLVVAAQVDWAASSSVSLEQARQVLLPLGLATAGWSWRSELRWVPIVKTALAVALLTSIWVCLEEFRQRPLMDPTWYFLSAQGGSPIDLRLGLPASYIADGIGGLTVFRPGGPYFNPPISGFILGLGAFAAITRTEWGRHQRIAVGFIGLALVFAYARAGLLIFAAVTIAYWAWTRLGRSAGLLLGIVVAAYAYLTFVRQGNTASHVNGFRGGVVAALQNPLGGGFGGSGYQSHLASGVSGVGSESLLGLYAAWLGLPALGLVFWVVYRLLTNLITVGRTKDALIQFVGLAFLLAAASSESASAMSGTPVLWMLLGYAATRDRRFFSVIESAGDSHSGEPNPLVNVRSGARPVAPLLDPRRSMS